MLKLSLIAIISVSGLFGRTFADYTAEAKADQVLKLPGLQEGISFNQFSGYLKVNNSKNLHYWMVESQGNPSIDPVAFWYVQTCCRIFIYNHVFCIIIRPN